MLEQSSALKLLPLLRGDGVPGPPTHVQVDLVGLSCNHSCNHCFFVQEDRSHLGKGNERVAARRNIYPMQDVVRLLVQLRDADAKAVTFPGGGEPSLHPAFREIVLAAAEWFKVGLITNLSLPWKTYEGLGKKVAWIRVSLDAANAEAYNAVHRPKDLKSGGGWDRTVTNIMRLVEEKGKAQTPDIGISYLVAPGQKLVDIPIAVALAEKLGVTYIQFKPVDDRRQPIKHEVWEKAYHLVEEAATRHGGIRVINQLGRATKGAYITLQTGYDRGYDRCRFTDYRCDITSDGRMAPCCFLTYADKDYNPPPELPLGAEGARTFQEVWASRTNHLIDVQKCPPCQYDAHNLLLQEFQAVVEARDSFV